MLLVIPVVKTVTAMMRMPSVVNKWQAITLETRMHRMMHDPAEQAKKIGMRSCFQMIKTCI